MNITLNVTVTTPLSDEDAAVSTGVAMRSMTVANYTLVQEATEASRGQQHPRRHVGRRMEGDGLA